MSEENIYAYTETFSSYPAFISINSRDGRILLTARQRGYGGERGATIDVDEWTLSKLVMAVCQDFARVLPSMEGAGDED